MPPTGFEPAITASDLSQTLALDRSLGHWDSPLKGYSVLSAHRVLINTELTSTLRTEITDVYQV
jgi:hypothetical protein